MLYVDPNESPCSSSSLATPSLKYFGSEWSPGNKNFFEGTNETWDHDFRILRSYWWNVLKENKIVKTEKDILLSLCLKFDMKGWEFLSSSGEHDFKPFVPKVPFLYPLECFQGVEKGCIGNEEVKNDHMSGLKQDPQQAKNSENLFYDAINMNVSEISH